MHCMLTLSKIYAVKTNTAPFNSAGKSTEKNQEKVKEDQGKR